jgi:hypothetical protein
MQLRVSRSSLNAADDVESHEQVFDVDPRRTVVAVIDEVVRRGGFLPRAGMGDCWTARDGRGGPALAVVIQGGSSWESARSLASPDTEIAAVADVLFFEHAARHSPA